MAQHEMSLSNKLRGLREVWAFDNRLWLAVTKTFFRQESLHIYRYKGAEILIDHAGGDANGAREILLSQMYRRFLPKMTFDGPANVLDLGANNGGFPLLFATSGIKLNRVVSVEFNPQTFVRLHFNLTRNLDCEVVPVNAALCGSARSVEVTLGRGSVSDSIYAGTSNEEGERYTIQGLTLDHFCAEYFSGQVIDVCKIDVEGAEFEVFLEPNHNLISTCRYLIMEIHEHNGRAKEQIIPALEAKGLLLQKPEAGADPSVHFFKNSQFA